MYVYLAFYGIIISVFFVKKSPKMLFRLATLADAANLRHLSESTFRDTYTAFNTPENMEKHVNKNFTIEQLERELQTPDSQYFIIESDGVIIAFAKLVCNHTTPGLNEKRVVEIERFYVKRDFHGQQLGRKMMDFCMTWAKAQAFEVVWLGVWEHNPNAIAFYRRMGFEHFGEHTFVLGDEVQTDFVMKRAV